MLKFNTAVLIRVNRDRLETHDTDTINPQDFAINTANIVSIQRTDSNTLVIHTNATITMFPMALVEDRYPAPMTYTVVFSSEAERDRIFNGLVNNN